MIGPTRPNLPRDRLKKRIVYFQYTNPAAYPPLERSTRLLANAGWDVLVLGLLRPGTDALRFPPHPGITERYTFNATTGWRLRLHYVWFAVWVIGWTLRWRASWVYASDLLSCPVALLLSVVPGLRILYHEHDEPARRHGLIAYAQRGVRRLVARRAELRVLPNAQRAGYFEQTISGGRPALRVWNCPSATEVGQPRNGALRHDAVVRVVYSGSVTPERLPMTFLEAMARIRGRVRLRVVGYETIGYPRYIQQLKVFARQLEIVSDIDFVGVLPRHRLHEVWDTAGVGLALNPMQASNNNSRWMVGASNKPFDYMANGLALLVSDLADWRETFVLPGFGIACDPRDAGSMASALCQLADHPAEVRAMGERGRQQIARCWNYESQFQPVVTQLAC
ncbi:MAG: glycosyltransferase [Chloroflexi bacterium]|nr:glycosyltransferase [Chloroflexota bacterium]